MNKGIHRVAAGTKRARQLQSATSYKANHSDRNFTADGRWISDTEERKKKAEIADWNAEVDRKKAAKKAKP